MLIRGLVDLKESTGYPVLVLQGSGQLSGNRVGVSPLEIILNNPWRYSQKVGEICFTYLYLKILLAEVLLCASFISIITCIQFVNEYTTCGGEMCSLIFKC